jgi:hypothetical protein
MSLHHFFAGFGRRRVLCGVRAFQEWIHHHGIDALCRFVSL